MASECERVLQRCQKLAGTKRNTLAGEIIEATECLKAWGEPPPGHGRARAAQDRSRVSPGQILKLLAVISNGSTLTDICVLIVDRAGISEAFPLIYWRDILK